MLSALPFAKVLECTFQEKKTKHQNSMMCVYIIKILQVREFRAESNLTEN